MSTATDLRAERIRRGLTQADVAEALGVHRQTVNRWERGKLGIHPAQEKLIRMWIDHPD